MIINMTSGGVMPSRILDAQAITPGTEDIVFEEGTYLRGPLTIQGDPDLIPEKIKDGENIFGIPGTPGGSGRYVWQRGNYTAEIVEEFYFTKQSQREIKLNKTGVPISKLIGKIIASQGASNQTYIRVDNATSAYHYVYGSGGGAVAITYNENTGTLIFTGSTPFYAGNWNFPILTHVTPAVFDLINYAVDDNASAYPNGTIHTDGYYYELLAAVSSANVMSLSNNALDTVQQDYRDQIETEVSNA